MAIRPFFGLLSLNARATLLQRFCSIIVLRSDCRTGSMLDYIPRGFRFNSQVESGGVSHIIHLMSLYGIYKLLFVLRWPAIK
jgi:hypothetical protein